MLSIVLYYKKESNPARIIAFFLVILNYLDVIYNHIILICTPEE